MQQHPFVQDFSNGTIFPSQNIPLKKKDDKWKRLNMDVGETIGRLQFAKKQRLLDNYKLINGELVKREYFDTEEDKEEFDLIEYVSKELAIPGFLKNYDIIGQPVRTLEGEMDAFPDVFNVIGKGDIFDSERERVKTDLLREWFMELVTNSINQKLGYEETPEFEDSEEGQQQQQQYEQQVQSLTPPEIQSYMSVSYRHILEEWGQNELEDQFHRFKLKALRRREFHHFLVAGERYRHLYTDGKGLKVESLNPIYTFSYKSPDIDFIQDGDIAGTIKMLSVPAIIDRYGHLMTDKQIDSLEASYKSKNESDYGKHLDGSPIKHLSPYQVPYQTRVPSLDPNFNSLFPDMRSNYSGSSSFMTEEELSKIDGTIKTDYLGIASHNLLVVTQMYWRSQKRIGKLTIWNEEVNEIEVILIDESYEVPEWITEIRNQTHDYPAGINTIVWTRQTEIWEGIKISNYNSNGIMKEPIYLKIQPAEIQIGKLLIAGQFANNINTKPTSLVDRLKPWQFFFNVLINQCYHHFETELKPFIILTADMIPNSKDWGGNEGLRKWLSAAKGGITAIDSNPAMANNNLGGQFPRVIDMDVASRVISRMNLAIQIKQFALEQVGISPQRLGNIKASETATGISQAQNNSYTQTSSWFTTFFEAETDILQMQLDAAKSLQATGREFYAQNVKSDLSIQAIKTSIEEGWLYDLHLYVVDSQEELRNIQTARELAINNNTSDIPMSARIEMATSSNVKEIIGKLKHSEEQMAQRMQQDFQMKQQELEQQGLNAQEALEQTERHFNAKLANDLNIAIIRALGQSRENDVDQSGTSDVLDYVDVMNKSTQITNQNNIAQGKLALEQQKERNAVSIAEKKLRSDREKYINDQILADKKIEQARIQGDKSK